MSQALQFECEFRVRGAGLGAARQLTDQPAPPPTPAGRVPRIARQMALAIRFEGLVRSGAVRDYSELARLGHVTRARITQIMNLLLLATDIQEVLLFLPRVTVGKDRIRLRTLQAICLMPDWEKQRRMWRELRAAEESAPWPISGS
jgi:hypothetical protein